MYATNLINKKVGPQGNIKKRFPCPKWDDPCDSCNFKSSLFHRWEAVYSSDEEGEAGGAETEAVLSIFYQLGTILKFLVKHLRICCKITRALNPTDYPRRTLKRTSRL